MTRRRVVTGHDAEGRSIISSNGPTPGRFDNGEFEELWGFNGVPASLTEPTDPADLPTTRLVPTHGRMACRIFTINPLDGTSRPNDDLEGERPIDLAEVEQQLPITDLWMHRTPTLDVIVIISGAMALVLDGGDEVHLQSGDSVVQRGTMHAWRNTGNEPCVAVAFMVRADAIAADARSSYQASAVTLTGDA